MSSVQDPFYIVKEEIQESIDKLHLLFTNGNGFLVIRAQVHLTKELLAACESIEWHKLDHTARTQHVGNARKAVVAGREVNISVRRELMRIVEIFIYFLITFCPFCLCIVWWMQQQDEEWMSLVLVWRNWSVGLTIHEELLAQEKIIDDLGMEMDSTSNRLDFVQKKVAMVMKKASAKGQLMMILFLVVLFIILFVLVFLT
ncbi:syntaxin [Salix suchowensis]|nr:syntaxin [Salix suchowensis]